MQVSDKEISVFPELCTLEECAANCGNMVCSSTCHRGTAKFKMGCLHRDDSDELLHICSVISLSTGSRGPRVFSC